MRSDGERSMRIIVQKFGGTSVSSPAHRDRAAERVVQAVHNGYSVVVVVSAMGRSGDPYATDTLLGIARDACPETTTRELDLMMSCGEIVSAVVFAGTLRATGVDALAMTGGQAGLVTDEGFSCARIIRMDVEPVRRQLEAGRVVVVAGFQGRSESGEVTTLGRGGSDTTACALGAALGAEIVEIYTDVEGVYTADPRLVPDARTIAVVGYDELAQMAHLGAKVIHPQAVEIAMAGAVPLRVRSTFSDGPGTLITGPTAEGRRWPDAGTTGGRVITAVTHLADVTLIRVGVPEGGDDLAVGVGAEDPELRVFETIAAAGISVDLINVSPTVKSFIVAANEALRAKACLEKAGCATELRPNCAKVSVVGSGMRGVPGVMAQVVRALRGVGAHILQTSDSHVTISCLIPMECLERAVRALHEQFGLSARMTTHGGGSA
jgi:aspartate kinase